MALRATRDFVVYCTGIVEKRANNFLKLACVVIKNSRCITFRSELLLGAIGNGKTFVGKELWLAQVRVFELDE